MGLRRRRWNGAARGVLVGIGSNARVHTWRWGRELCVGMIYRRLGQGGRDLRFVVGSVCQLC